MTYPVVTLFMLMSLDGKISTGQAMERDFDKDLPNIKGVGAGLEQYYQLEKETDLFSLNTGKVMAKVGWNHRNGTEVAMPVTFIIIDNEPHLSSQGVQNLARVCKKLLIVTTNSGHPAVEESAENIEVIQYENKINFNDLFEKLLVKGVDRLTVQSGGELNAVLVRAGLINFVSIVIAPLLVGGRATPTLVDGESLENLDDLKKLRSLRLIQAEPLADSYLHLKYEVLNHG